MSFLAAAIFLLLLKLAMTVALAGWLCARLGHPSVCFGILAGWLGVQALQLCGMVGLSLLNSLTPATYSVWVGLQAVALMLVAVKTRAGMFPLLASRLRNPVLWPALIALLFVTGLLSVRGLFFFDTSFDVYSYGFPRLGYFFQHHSIFAREPGMVWKMFCNEWNAELNALHYGLLTDNDRAFTLAGIEVWWVAFVAIAWLARALSASIPVSLWIGLLIASTPSIFNLAGVTKGDVLGMAAVVSALGGLFWMRSSGRCFPAFIFAFLWLAYGAGCKGNIIPVFAMFVVLSIFWLSIGRRWLECFHSPVVLFLVVCCLMLFLSRHAANLMVFHNPLKRVPYENAFGFRWNNLPAVLLTQVLYLFGISPDAPWQFGFHGAMNRDLAVTGWLLAASIIPWLAYCIGHRKAHMPFFALPPGGVAWLSAAFTVGMIPTWLFLSGQSYVDVDPDFISLPRIFLPFLIPVSVYVFLCLSQTKSAMQRPLLVFIITGLVVAANLSMAFAPSEIMSTRGLKRLPFLISNQSQVATRLESDFTNGPGIDLGELAKMRGQSQRILILMPEDDSPIYQFFGKNMEWHVEMAGSADAMRKWLNRAPFDWVVLSRNRDESDHNRVSQDILTDLQEEHFALQCTEQWDQIYKRQ